MLLLYKESFKSEVGSQKLNVISKNRLKTSGILRLHDFSTAS